MWCQNCGQNRAHYYHEITSPKAKYCQRCCTASRTAHTYCRYCGEFRSEGNILCDVHGGGSGSCVASSRGGSDSPPSCSPPTYGSDEDDDYATDLSSPRSLGPASLSPARPSPVSGSSSSSSGISDERKKSGFCKLWFESNRGYDDHAIEKNSGCSKHKLCFPDSDNYQHAKDSYHERCFLPGCKPYYAEYSDNTDKEIIEHVWEEHTVRG